MAATEFRDYSRSRAILVGTAQYSQLEPIPAAEKSIRAIHRMLAGPNCGWPEGRISEFFDEPSAEGAMRKIGPLLKEAKDVLLFYYVGHGISVNDGRDLCLTTSGTVQGDLADSTSLLLSRLYKLTSGPDYRDTTRIFLLDCCFSGVGVHLGPEDPVERISAIPSAEGVFTLTAAKQYQLAFFEPGPDGMTYFTKSLADIVDNGIEHGPAGLTLLDIYDSLERRFHARGRATPLRQTPDKRSTSNADRYVFARNAAVQPTPSDIARPAILPGWQPGPGDQRVPPPSRATEGRRGGRRRPAAAAAGDTAATGAAGPPIPARRRKAGIPALAWAAIIIVVAAVAAASGYLLRPAGPSAAPPPATSPATAGSSSAAAAPPATPLVWHQGTFTLPADYNASLESASSANWEIKKNEIWPPGDIKYDAAVDTLDMANAPQTTAVLGTRFAWNYQTCLNASYGGTSNDPKYGNITGGHGICFKTPANQLALLEIIKKTQQKIVLKATVWQEIDPSANVVPAIPSAPYRVFTNPNSVDDTAVAFSPDGKTLAASDANGGAFLWDVGTGSFIAGLASPNRQSVWDVAFSPNGTTVADCTSDRNNHYLHGSVYLWNVTSPATPIATFPDPRGAGVGTIAFNPDGKLLAAADNNGTVYLLDSATLAVARTLQSTAPGAGYGLAGLAFSPDGSELAGASNNGSVYVWNTTTGTLVSGPLYDPDNKDAQGIAFSPDGKTVAVADTNGSAYIWNLATGQVVGAFRDPAGLEVMGVAFTPDGSALVTTSGSGKYNHNSAVRVWDVATGRLIHSFQDPDSYGSGRLALSHDGRSVAVADGNAHAYLWSLGWLHL